MSAFTLQGFFFCLQSLFKVFFWCFGRNHSFVVLLEGLTPFTQAKNISMVSCFFRSGLILRGVPIGFPKTMIQCVVTRVRAAMLGGGILPELILGQG